MRYVGLDLSTKTGMVALLQDGEITIQLEIDRPCDTPESMNDMAETVSEWLNDDDIVCIEDFGYGSQQGFQLGGIGWLVRVALWKRGIKFYTVAPASLKKFTGSPGNVKKDVLAVAIYKRWGFEHNSDNVRDAYVLAEIARATQEPVELIKAQREVLDVVLGKKPVKAKKERKKK